MDKITKQIFIGNFIDSRNEKKIKDNNINTILNVAKELPENKIDGIGYRKVGLINGDTEENKTKLQEAISILKGLINSGKVVLVHCYAGKNRSSFVIAKTLASINNTNWKDEFRKIKEKHPIATILPWMEKIQ